MTKLVQLHRMNTQQAANYTGPQGELIVDTGSYSIRVQDNATPGGWLTLSASANLNDLGDKAAALTNLGAIGQDNPNFTGNAGFAGNATVDGDLLVDGTSTVGGNSGVGGNFSVNGSSVFTGNIGIGTNPIFSLDILNNQNASTTGRISNNNAGGNGALAEFSTNNGTAVCNIGIFGLNYTPVGIIVPGRGFVACSSDLAIYTANATDLIFGTNTIERMRVSHANLELQAPTLKGIFNALKIAGLDIGPTLMGGKGNPTFDGSLSYNLPGGLILKAGYIIAPGTGGVDVIFPTAFPNNILFAWSMPQESGSITIASNAFANSKTKMQVSSTSSGAFIIAWFALGY